ncbi:MAG: hypothetical protein F6J87_19895 [Spirulina sp. SIO3F2]|nr:hypothetical protein [Spirulina sp. SIO3F2]
MTDREFAIQKVRSAGILPAPDSSPHIQHSLRQRLLWLWQAGRLRYG